MSDPHAGKRWEVSKDMKTERTIVELKKGTTIARLTHNSLIKLTNGQLRFFDRLREINKLSIALFSRTQS